MHDRFAVYQKPDGALVALSNHEVPDPRFKKCSRDFRSIGRAIVAKIQLERTSNNGGGHAA